MDNTNKLPTRGSQSIIAVIIAVVIATLLAFVFVPGLRETRLGHALGFWQSSQSLQPPPPLMKPAVPAGQLGKEMAQQQQANPSDTITIDAATATNLALQTAIVEARAFDQPIRTTGRITADERRITHVHTKVDGWVEKALANFEGQEIRKGQPLFTFYSPDLVATEQEYLLALRARSDFKKSEFDVVRASGDSLVEAARRRLQLWDLTKEQLDEIERTGTPPKNITFFSPADGVITERKVFPGVHIMPDTDLYSLADLSIVWVEASVFESDLANIRIGTRGTVMFPDGGSQTSNVTYINPMIEPQTRTGNVRLELINNNLRLKPGMYVDVSFNIQTPPQLTVPRDAVLDTGTRKLVLVDNGNNSFTLREINTGKQGQEYYTITSGLTAGEKVARNIQFLIDSETPLRQAVEQRYQSATPNHIDGMSGINNPANSNNSNNSSNSNNSNTPTNRSENNRIPNQPINPINPINPTTPGTPGTPDKGGRL